MALNLIRNARMFYTTVLDAQSNIDLAGTFDATNTREIQVLDGLSFSQATGSETVTVNEAGTAPIRGQRQFNTSLEPVEITFSTYMRPFRDTSGASAVITAEEDVLWTAFATGRGNSAAWDNATTTGASAVAKLTMAQSAKNQMAAFGIFIILDQTAYTVDNCALDQATIDFGLDGIATIAWTARGTKLTNVDITANKPAPGTDITLGGTSITGASPKALNKNISAEFLANKLSSVTLSSINVGGNYGGGASRTYNLALTGGSITLSNNITYLTPANLGIVNKPFTYFTGTRAVSGTLNCYLKTGTTNSAGLIDAMLDYSTNIEPSFALTLHIGGNAAAYSTRVSLIMPSVVLQIPTINTEQVVSTAINFTAQGLDTAPTPDVFDITQNNEIDIEYRAV